MAAKWAFWPPFYDARILPDHLIKGALTQTLPDRLVTGIVPSVSASVVLVWGLIKPCLVT